MADPVALDVVEAEVESLRLINQITHLLGFAEPAAAVLAVSDRLGALRRDHPGSALIAAVADQGLFAAEIADAPDWEPLFRAYRARMEVVHHEVDLLRQRLGHA